MYFIFKAFFSLQNMLHAGYEDAYLNVNVPNKS